MLRNWRLERHALGLATHPKSQNPEEARDRLHIGPNGPHHRCPRHGVSDPSLPEGVIADVEDTPDVWPRDAMTAHPRRRVTRRSKRKSERE